MDYEMAVWAYRAEIPYRVDPVLPPYFREGYEMMHMDFILPYRPVYLLKIKTTNGASAAIAFYTFGSCLPFPLVSVYNDFTHGTFE